MKEIPTVSVIIPMYNAEKYIAECLNSLLTQTLKNFEVIVVDDCSTDSSFAIAESYAPKFNERLTLTKTKKNSGGGGYVPRNIGLGLSCGEYVFFVDADDFITKNALENLYTTAKKFDADVIYTAWMYRYTTEKGLELRRDKPGKFLFENGHEDRITLTTDNSEENLKKLLFGYYFHTPWTKFVQRKFLIENEISFPKIFTTGDFLWTIQVFYNAKKFLRFPVPIYFYRNNISESITKKKDSPDKQISKCVKAFFLNVKALQELATKITPLQNKTYFHVAISSCFKNCLERTFNERMNLKTQAIYEILCREFMNDDLPSSTMPFLFSVIDTQQKTLIQAQQQFEKFNRFAATAQKRIAELENEIKRLKSKE